MFRTLRTKLLIGLTPLLAILVGLGLWAVVMFGRLGSNIDVILKENYQSVLYAERMKEALERMDSALLFALAGEEEQARAQFADNRPKFEKALKDEHGNITLIAEGEGTMVEDLTRSYDRYLKQTGRYFALSASAKDQRRRMYFGEILQTFLDIKHQADSILDINQKNMEDMNKRAIHSASVSIRLMILSLLGAAAVATVIALLLARSLLEPIRSLTHAARAMAKGNYDQVVPATSRDEIGEMADAFNAMARRIREYQAAGTARLLRAQQTAQATIDSFPDPVVVVDTTGTVERANPAARRILGVTPSDDSIPWVAPPALRPALADVLHGEPDYLPTGVEHATAFRDDGQERYYLPRVLSIRDDDEGLLGAAVVLQEVTKFRLVDQLKSDMVSTVSHELKTPLTSIQMAVHLLLEEVVGPLTPKQVELMLAARQDSARLLAMVNDLLDLTRIEQGRLRLDLAPIASGGLISEAAERWSSRAHDAGIEVTVDVMPGLTPVMADRERIGHVFDNLVGNALRHTERGGWIRVSARPGDEVIAFTVEDNGEGIAPEHVSHIFEKFYRVPGARHRGGAGLGLAIVREIVAAHGGHVDVISRPGEGTKFTFTLPVAPDDPSAQDGRTS